MNLLKISFPRAWLAASCAMAAVAACGGGVGSGGTGFTGSVSVGTVNGFGSIIVDGLRVDDRQVAALSETSPGHDSSTDAQLGQRVEVSFDNDGVARSLRVEASLVGQVTSVDAGNAAAVTFHAIGQTVSINTLASAGPVTQLAGYAAPADVQPGDVVEVHGVLRTQAGGLIQATRVEKKTALPDYLRVSGIVSALAGGSAPSFTLGGLSVSYGSAQLSPSGSALANGQAVVVLARPADLGVPVGGQLQPLVAASVRIKAGGPQGVQAYASGFIVQLDATSHRFTLDGQAIDYAQATIAPAGTTLASGQYVQVRGSYAVDGTLTAAQVTRRNGEAEPEAELKGTLIGYDSATSSFQVRGVKVTALGAALSSCPAGGLRDGLYVEIEGGLGSAGVVASKVKCEDEPSGAVVEREGTAGSVDGTASTFVLSGSTSTLTVRWSALTIFKGVTAATLSGQRVEVEGTLVNGVLQASKVAVED